MRVGGFDLAPTSGCAILDGAKVIHVEAFRATGDGDGEVFRSFRKWFHNTLTKHEVQRAALEQPLVTDIQAPAKGPNAKPGETRNPVTMRTYLRLYGLRAHAVEICERLNLPVIEVHQGSWRKSFTGSGRATKEDTLALAQQIVPGLKSKDAAEAIGIAWHLNGLIRAENQSARIIA